MQQILLVGLGGFVGAASRYLIQTQLGHRLPGTFPWGTFVINIVGCLIIGIIYGLAERHKLMEHEMRLFLAVGFCGSFTTFSAFSVENLNMLQIGNYLTVGAYIALSIIFGLAAVFGGIQLAR
ncbi:MAG: fluoride efflux transporter CrcB [Bacteroidetes bacterium]|nr:fluoride efflux transporter CrcB [Bacteroidota bacterium]